MATNSEVSVDLARKVVLKPVLKDAAGKTMNWTDAKKELGAKANWMPLANEDAGTLEAQADGTAIFTPTAEGAISVDCVVGLKNPFTGENAGTVDSGVDITVTQ